MTRIPKRSAPEGDEKRNTEDNSTALQIQRKNIQSNSSEEDIDLLSDFATMQYKKEKKLNKDITTAVNTPLALTLKYFTSDNPVRAAANEAAVLLRAKKPGSATLYAILKNDKLIKWDHPLLLVSIISAYKHHADIYDQKGYNDLSKKLILDMKELVIMMAEDQILLPPDYMTGVMNSLLSKDAYLYRVLDLYKQSRSDFVASANRQRSIARLDGYCIGYNFKGSCDNGPTCNYWHYCLLHNDHQPHATMECSDNPNRNKIKKNNYKNNYNNNYYYNNYRGRGRGRGRGYHFPHNWNMNFGGYGQGAPNYQYNQQYQANNNNNPGNKQRFNKGGNNSNPPNK